LAREGDKFLARISGIFRAVVAMRGINPGNAMQSEAFASVQAA
jgi:hypothetical protein